MCTCWLTDHSADAYTFQYLQLGCLRMFLLRSLKQRTCFSQILKHRAQDEPMVKPDIYTWLQQARVALDVMMGWEAVRRRCASLAAWLRPWSCICTASIPKDCGPCRRFLSTTLKLPLLLMDGGKDDSRTTANSSGNGKFVPGVCTGQVIVKWRKNPFSLLNTSYFSISILHKCRNKHLPSFCEDTFAASTSVPDSLNNPVEPLFSNWL